MSPLKALGVIFLGRSAANSAHFIDFQVSKYPMMAIPTVLRSKQAEEKEHVTHANAIPVQMRLRRTRLTKSPTPI